MSTAALLRTDRAQLALGPPGRWQPRSLRAATVSTSDARMRDVGRVDADPLLVRLGGLAPGDVDRIAARAVDRYDAARGVPPFASYACPTILGELKRHFRDSGWNVRAPRRIQELGSRLVVAGDELTQLLHRSPTTTELATRLGVSRDEVLEAQCYATVGRPLTEPLRRPPAPHGCHPAGPIAGRPHRNVTHRG